MGLLKWLDGFLSEELRQAPPEELGRARVMAGAALALILVSGAASVAFLVTGMPWSYAVGTCAAAVGYVGTLWILRRASSARPAALLLSGIMSAGFSLTALSANDPFLPAHAAVMLITILTVYLLGPRLGLVVLIPVVLFVGIGFPLWRQNFGSELRAFPPGYEWLMDALAATSILAGWAIGWLYSTAHAATHAALERDIKARREAEAKLGELHRTLLDVSRQAEKSGHGFGLHISALAAEEMKGRLSAMSAGPGQGATFTIELPLQADEASSAEVELR